MHYWRQRANILVPAPAVGDEVTQSRLAKAVLLGQGSGWLRKGRLRTELGTAEGLDVLGKAGEARGGASEGAGAGEGVVRGEATPTTVRPGPGTLLSLARSRGYSALGEMFNATQLAGVASAAGYHAAQYQFTIETEHDAITQIMRLLDAKRPVIAPYGAETNAKTSDVETSAQHWVIIPA